MITNIQIFETTTTDFLNKCKDLYALLNKDLFEPKGIKCPDDIKIVIGKSNVVAGTVRSIRHRNGQRVVDQLKMSYAFMDNEQGLMDIMAHEMIHVYIVHNNINDSSAHGYHFKRYMDLLNDNDMGIKIDINHNMTPGEHVKRLTYNYVIIDQGANKFILLYALSKGDNSAVLLDSIKDWAKRRRQKWTVLFGQSDHADFLTIPKTLNPTKIKTVYLITDKLYNELISTNTSEPIIVDGKNL